MCFGSIDVHFGGKREVDAVIDGAKFFNRGVIAWLLVRKLIARKTKDNKPLAPQFFIEFLEAVILRGESALAGRVDNQNGLSAVCVKADFIAFIVGETQVV